MRSPNGPLLYVFQSLMPSQFLVAYRIIDRPSIEVSAKRLDSFFFFIKGRQHPCVICTIDWTIIIIHQLSSWDWTFNLVFQHYCRPRAVKCLAVMQHFYLLSYCTYSYNSEALFQRCNNVLKHTLHLCMTIITNVHHRATHYHCRKCIGFFKAAHLSDNLQ